MEYVLIILGISVIIPILSALMLLVYHEDRQKTLGTIFVDKAGGVDDPLSLWLEIDEDKIKKLSSCHTATFKVMVKTRK